MNREDFPMLNEDIIYLDNGATSLKPKCVIDKMTEYYEKYSANAHRGDYDISFKEALKEALSSLNIPIIYDFDLGHVSPRMTIINGAIANVHYKNHKATIEFEFK